MRDRVRRDPLRAGRDADLVRAAVATRDRAHRVRPVLLLVVRELGAAEDVEPVVVVVEVPATEVAAVLVHQGRVVVVDTGVDVRDHDALAGDAVLGPHVVGVDVGDAPLDRADLGLDLTWDRLILLDADPVEDRGDARQRGQLERQRLVAGLDVDGVDDPERLVRDVSGVEDRPDRRLRGLGVRLEVSGDRGAPGAPVGRSVGRRSCRPAPRA